MQKQKKTNINELRIFGAIDKMTNGIKEETERRDYGEVAGPLTGL